MMAVLLWAWLRRRARHQPPPVVFYVLVAAGLFGLALSALARTWWGAGIFGLALTAWWVAR